ncbi:putative membrane protein [Streptomyces davaonensis JCM 4913]|uniref:Putative membrane protein n=1 Tax=Streptomyces davaonensis (strain DSM 101723 / JCM 4913 / KCC S-0913 / 768) TaxID=1214101 RepID=K4QWH5_STRDJ|nr:hypothetical protein [Streptomyces davaonensis]CCK25292.1 putative membrane protein [Streptomyces davaonensis JCM 4913]
MKVRQAGTERATASGHRLLMAEAVLAGAVVLALLVSEFPSLRREVRIWRMAGGLRARRRYP